MTIIIAFLLGAVTFAAADFYRDWKKLRLEEMRDHMKIERRFNEFFQD